MRHSQLTHFAGKGAASGNEAKRKASGSVPPDGGGAHEALREHRGAVGGVRYISTPAVSVVAEKTLEVDFFKGALQKIEARRQTSDRSGARASTTRSGE